MKKLFSLVAIIMTATSFIYGQGYKVGDVAKDFSLLNIDGNYIGMGSMQKAKGYIVIFTCNSCPYAKAYESRIIQLDKKYASKGFPVVAINSNDEKIQPEDSYKKMQTLAKAKGYPFPYLYDSSQEIASMYGATRTPHVFLLNKENDQLIVKYIGAIDDNSDDVSKVKMKYVENAIDQILTNQEVAIKETKAIGCGIKWKKE